MMLAANIPITFSSDAHSPEEVGMDFKRAIKLASEIGFDSTVRFNKRKRSKVPFNF